MKLWIIAGSLTLVVISLAAAYIAYTLDNGPNYKIDLETKISFDPEDPIMTPGAV